MANRAFRSRSTRSALLSVAPDAQMLAELGARLQPEPGTPSPNVYAELQQWPVQREALSHIQAQVRNQHTHSCVSRG